MRFDVLITAEGRIALTPSALGLCSSGATPRGINCIGELELDFDELPDTVAREIALNGIGIAGEDFEQQVWAGLRPGLLARPQEACDDGPNELY